MENVARRWKRVRHDGRLRRRTDVVALTRGLASTRLVDMHTGRSGMSNGRRKECGGR
jgi:hypothetical protein